MKERQLLHRFGSAVLAGSLALASLAVGPATAIAGGTRISIRGHVGRPAFVHHHVHRPVIVHRPFVHRHLVRPIVVHPVVPKPVIVSPHAALGSHAGVVFTPPPPVVVAPRWVWAGSRWEWHTGGHIWVPGQWVWSGGHRLWMHGHWAY